MSQPDTTRPRDGYGHFVSTLCPDPNCGGTYRPERDGWWRCDGLTHDRDDGPLYACPNLIGPPYIERMPAP